MKHEPSSGKSKSDAGRKRYSAEPSKQAAPQPDPQPPREVTNEEVLKALLSMSEGITTIVRDTVAEHLLTVKQLASDVRDLEEVSFRGLRRELTDMVEHIDKTKHEIASLKPEDAQSDQILMATNELEAVVQATEQATSDILEQSEKIAELVEKLRADCGAGQQDKIPAHIDELEEISTQLLLACGFQDITGQRINKVVNTMLYIEQHISRMMSIWGIEKGTGKTHLMANAPDDDRPDKELLHGPQIDGGGVSQDDIDALFG